MTQQKLACEQCGGYKSKVVDSRPSRTGGIFRRRECLDCGHRFNTEELTQKYATARAPSQHQHKI